MLDAEALSLDSPSTRSRSYEAAASKLSASQHPATSNQHPMSSSPLLTELIEALRCLPGVGAKSAQRMALHLLERDREGGRRLSAKLADAVDRIGNCARCRNFSEAALCALCRNPQRDAELLCLVETPMDQLAVEQATGFRGYYFVMHGRLSPLDGLGPAELGLEQLRA